MIWELALLVAVTAIAVKLYITAPWVVCKDRKKLHGKTVIVTGANTGIGKETALALARRGARVILACRNIEKASRAKDEIVAETRNTDVVVRQLDLASLKSVRKFASDILKSEKRLDILINNAGCLMKEKIYTEDSLEYQMQSNHFGHFLLTNLLLGLLMATDSSRIVVVSALAHILVKKFDISNLNFTKEKTGERFFEIYSVTKLCNLRFTRELAKRLRYASNGKNVTVNALHPGIIETEFVRIPFLTTIAKYLGAFFAKSAKHGAQTTIYLAVAEELNGVSGQYFSDCKLASISKWAQNNEIAEELWMRSEELVQLKREEKYI